MNDEQAKQFIETTYRDIWRDTRTDITEKYYSSNVKAYSEDVIFDLNQLKALQIHSRKSFHKIEHTFHSIKGYDNKINAHLTILGKNAKQKTILELNTVATYQLKDDKISKLWFIWDHPIDSIISPEKRQDNQAIEKILTKRELDCFYFILKGKTAKQIAVTLNISNRTVESYIANLKSKLQINSNSALFEYAYAQGLLQTSAKLDELLESS